LTPDRKRKANQADRQRGQKTDEEIVRVATALFRERGYHGTAMGDVASAVGVTVASLYYYFENKQDVLLSVLRAGMETLLESLEEVASADMPPREKLHRALTNHIYFVLHHSDAVTVFIRERRFLESPRRELYQPRVDRYDTLFTTLVKDATTPEELGDVEPKLVSLLILGTINSMVEWYRPDGELSPDDYARKVTAVVERMFSLQLAPAQPEQA
jgi:AcrR family transcriptional regulator